ncbi:hypothetical protein YC2023_013951 [Brassica napus]
MLNFAVAGNRIQVAVLTAVSPLPPELSPYSFLDDNTNLTLIINHLRGNSYWFQIPTKQKSYKALNIKTSRQGICLVTTTVAHLYITKNLSAFSSLHATPYIHQSIKLHYKKNENIFKVANDYLHDVISP